MYQLFVGEIGIPRHEFLYELTWWEINSIIRGYRKRNRLTHQLLAEVVYAAMYANPYRQYDGKNVADLYPMLFENEEADGSKGPGLSQEEVAMLQAEMAAMNAGNEEVNP